MEYIDQIANLKKSIDNQTEIVRKEIHALTVSYESHKQSDELMFNGIGKSIEHINQNHDKIIEMLQESRDYRKHMMEKIDALTTQQESHNKLIQQGKGAFWITSIMLAVGGGIEAIKNIFHSK